MENTIRNLMFDVASGREIFDEEQNRVISKAEANDAIRKVCFEKLGLSEKATDKQIKRALKSDAAVELFEVVEEILDVEIAHGISENAFFNQFVETKNIADGDANEFWAEDDVLLTVSKVSGDHHDFSIQRLGAGKAYPVQMDTYGIKVGGDIRLFLLGRKDWSALIDAVAKAFVNKIQTLISAQFATGTNLITPPSKLTGNGAIVKTAFDDIIEKVEAANECPVMIMGTKSALRNLTALTTTGLSWTDPAESIKEAIAQTGIIGSYEGSPIMAIPQKFEDKALQIPVVNSKKIWIMPMVDNKFIKFVDGGESELEITEKGATMDDMQSYEVQRKLGVSTLMTRYYGEWTLP